MPRDKHSGLFKKGQSGNPAGSSKRHRAVAGLARMSHLDVVELGTEILTGDLSKLAGIKDDPKASVNKIWLASLIVQGIQKRDYRCWEAVMNRIIGKPKETSQVELTGKDGAPLNATAHATEDELVKELAGLRARTKSLAK